MRKYTAILIVLSLLYVSNVFAQYKCLTNIDFEDGTLTNWEASTGTCCPITTSAPAAPVTGRHTITSGTGLDPYGFFPVVAPGGGNYSLMLGNNKTGRQAEKVRYYVKVPSLSGDFFLTYRFAIVFQEPGHPSERQPRFVVTALDSATGDTLACNNYEYVASSFLPGFQKSSVGQDVYFRDWNSASINLSKYNGQTIAIEFASGDCDMGGHFGYGYIDMDCGFGIVSAYSCGNAPYATLTGPSGFSSYKWMDDKLDSVYYTTQNVTVPVSKVLSRYALVMVPYRSLGCPDTIFVDYVNSVVKVDLPLDTTVCYGDSVSLKPNVTSTVNGLYYNWTPSSWIACDTCKNSYVQPSNSTRYTLTVTDVYGCADTASQQVIVVPAAIAVADPDTTVCKGDYITLRGSGGVNYHWFPDSLFDFPMYAFPVVRADSSMDYFLEVENTYGCKDTTQLKMIVNPKPIVKAEGDTILCPGDFFTLNGSGVGNYIWHPSVNLDDYNKSNPRGRIDTTTKYKLTITNQYGCVDSDYVLIKTYPKPDASAGVDTQVCPGAQFVLSGSGGESCKWSPALFVNNVTLYNPFASINEGTEFKIIVTNEYDCNDSDKVFIDILPASFSIDTPAAACAGTYVQLNANGGDDYTWEPALSLNDHQISDPIAQVFLRTGYSVIIHEFLCDRLDTLYTSVQVLSTPELSISSKNPDCGKIIGYLKASGANKYKWTPEEGLFSSDSSYTIATPKYTTTYTVLGTNENGCSDTASVTLDVFEGDGRLFIPDAFTPNGDGVNDCYKVHVPGDVTRFEFSIYNRYGERVFYTTSVNDCWDGYYKSSPAELATYFYYYKATSSVCGDVFRKGDMHLIR